MRATLLTFLFFAGGVSSSFAADDLATAAATAEARLESAVAELAALREQIASEKVPVAAELRSVETMLMEKRREADRLQRMRDNAGVEVSTLQNQLNARQEELAYVGNLLADYANRLNASLHTSELQLYTDSLLRILNVGEDSEVSLSEKLDQQSAAVLLGIERLEKNAGGHAFAGNAVLPDGHFEEGKFALLGPIAFFANEAGTSAGLAERGSSLEPRVLQFDQSAIPAIAAFVKDEKGEVPLDTTLGRATAIAASRESLVSHIKKGGLWMFPILAFAGLSLTVAAFKFVEISRYKPVSRGRVTKILELLHGEKRAEAERVARDEGGAGSPMLQEGVRNSHLSKELLDEILFESILEVKPKLERGLAFISVTAAVAPLLGLLGTVTGMINTFKLITLFGTGDAKSLSSGISEALITTEFGLIVAIPALLLSAFLSRKANSIIASMEQAAITFVNGVAVINEVGERETAHVA